MQIETQQVVLTLTSDKNILSALRANKAFRTDKNGVERLVRPFNSQDFEFRAGGKITVGKTVAAALKRDTSFVMGDGLTGPLVCPLVEVGAFEAGKGTIGVGDLVCPYCHTKFDTAPKLGRHLYRAASECSDYKAEAGDGGEASEEPQDEPRDDEEHLDPELVDEPRPGTPQPDKVEVAKTPAVRTSGPRIGRQA
jgi:hypothetical protein